MNRFLIKILLLFCVAILLYNNSVAQKKPKPKPVKIQYGYFPNSVFYDIYVPSFCDFNNDSIGDIKGVTHQLNYVSSLGAEVIVVSPLCWTDDKAKKGPIDFRTIDPQYGTLADLKELVAEAHKKNISVLISFNINYTGVMHPWFLQGVNNTALQKNYVWKKSMTQKSGSDNFHKAKNYNDKYYGYAGNELPVLNFDNVNVKTELTEACKYLLLQSNADGIKFNDVDLMYTSDYNQRFRVWNSILKDLKKEKDNIFFMAQPTDTFTMNAKLIAAGFNASTSNPLTDAIIKSVTGGRDEGLVHQIVLLNDSFYKINHNALNFIFSGNENSNRFNHSLNISQQHAAAALLLTLTNGNMIFYGDELGLRGLASKGNNTEGFIWDYSDRDDNRAYFIPNTFNTDSAIMPYNIQVNNGNSLYHFYRKLCWIRKQNDPLREGTLVNVESGDKRLITFYRDLKSRRIFIIQNISSTELTFDLEKLNPFNYSILFTNSTNIISEHGTIKLSPYSTVIYQSK